jgi:hypothetical protein
MAMTTDERFEKIEHAIADLALTVENALICRSDRPNMPAASVADLIRNLARATAGTAEELEGIRSALQAHTAATREHNDYVRSLRASKQTIPRRAGRRPGMGATRP